MFAYEFIYFSNTLTLLCLKPLIIHGVLNGDHFLPQSFFV